MKNVSFKVQLVMLLLVGGMWSFPAASQTDGADTSDDVFRNKKGRLADVTSPPDVMSKPIFLPDNTKSKVIPVAVIPAPVVSKITFELRATDRSVKNVFMRWAEEQKIQVVWRLAGDLPLDAGGSIQATSLADALTQIAASFADKPEPFVIREYDNVIVVMSRWAARP